MLYTNSGCHDLFSSYSWLLFSLRLSVFLLMILHHWSRSLQEKRSNLAEWSFSFNSKSKVQNCDQGLVLSHKVVYRKSSCTIFPACSQEPLHGRDCLIKSSAQCIQFIIMPFSRISFVEQSDQQLSWSEHLYRFLLFNLRDKVITLTISELGWWRTSCLKKKILQSAQWTL